MNFSRAEDDAAEAAALAVDVLGGRIDDAVGAELERALPQRRREHVVDHQRARRPRARSRRPPRCRCTSSVGLVGVSRKNVLVFGRIALRHCVEIGAVDQRRGDAEARQEILDHVAAGAEQRLARRRRGRRPSPGPSARRDRRHAGRGRARGLRAFERGHALLEHRHGRIGEARIAGSPGPRP